MARSPRIASSTVGVDDGPKPLAARPRLRIERHLLVVTDHCGEGFEIAVAELTQPNASGALGPDPNGDSSQPRHQSSGTVPTRAEAVDPFAEPPLIKPDDDPARQD
jgi:hypothetical protein